MIEAAYMPPSILFLVMEFLCLDHSYHFALALEAGKQKCRSLSLLFALTLV